MSSVPVLRWRVGDVEVLRVVEMELPVPASFLFGEAKLDVLERAAWLRPDFVTAEGLLVISIHAFLVDDGRHRMIVDTCIGNDKVRNAPFFNQLHGPFLEHIAELGYPADSIDRVLCTHMHVDHVGWNTRLEDGKWVPTFPNARYLFARTEWEHWRAEKPDPGSDLIGDSVKPILDAGLADLVECDHRVSPAISLEPTPGHTPGHVSVRIRSQGAEAVIAGDLMHHPLQIADPDVGALFDTDAERARETRREFLARCANAPVLVFGTHFAAPTAGNIVADGGGMRLISAPRSVAP